MNEGCSNQKGFTLIETIIVLTIIGILLSITYPSFARVKAKWSLEMAARFLVSDIRQWEYQAIAEQKSFRFLLNKEKKTYYIRDGMKIEKSKDLSDYIAGISFTDGMNDFYLLPSGATSRAGHFTLKSHYHDIKYVYVLNTTGRVRAANHITTP